MAGDKERPRNFKFPVIRQTGPGNANREIGVPRAVWHSRGYLPHFECAELPQHVTFHLADSLAHDAMLVMESEVKFLPEKARNLERRKRLEEWMAAGYGSCVLLRSEIADMAQASLLRFDSERYRLIAWVVMPNHVHTLFIPMSGWNVAQIVASWKKFMARNICRARRSFGDEAAGPVWHREYWDRYIRDQRHMVRVVDYIHLNPVRAGLVEDPANWRWSSAFSGNANLHIGA